MNVLIGQSVVIDDGVEEIENVWFLVFFYFRFEMVKCKVVVRLVFLNM